MSRTWQTQIRVWSETLMNSYDDDDDALTKILRVWRALGKSARTKNGPNILDWGGGA